jgi:hypothetical protein
MKRRLFFPVGASPELEMMLGGGVLSIAICCNTLKSHPNWKNVVHLEHQVTRTEDHQVPAGHISEKDEVALEPRWVVIEADVDQTAASKGGYERDPKECGPVAGVL